MKRFLNARLLPMLLVLLLTTGCSLDGLSYYQISKDLNEWQVTEAIHSEGEMTFTINYIYDELLGMTGAEVDSSVIDYINAYKLIYSMDSDTQNGLMTMTMNLLNTTTEEVLPLFTMSRENYVTFIKVDDYINSIVAIASEFLEESEIEELQVEIDSFLGDLQYIEVSDEEIFDFYKTQLEDVLASTEDADEMIEEIKSQYTDPDIQNQKRLLSDEIVDLLIEDVYSDFSLDIIKKDGDKYTLTIDDENLGTTLYDYSVCSLENSDALFSTAKTFVESLSEEEFTMLLGAYATSQSSTILGSQPTTLNQRSLAEQIDVFAVDFDMNREMYIEELNSYLEMYNTMYKEYIKGSFLTHSLEKDGDTITSDFYLEANINDVETNTVMANVSLSVISQYEKIDEVTIQTPTENVKTLTELMDSFPKEMNIHLPSETYTMSQNFEYDYGYIDIVVKDGTSYLPMRMIGEMFGEEIMWDDTIKKPYFLYNDEIIYVEEVILVDSTSYIKTREFEKIGYIIEWDPDTMTITITK